jgi:exodeoxyribonuclease VII large subunit
LVTAKESAALHDMLKIIEKRWPLVSVIIADTLVQGESAAGEIATALRYADTLNADVIVVGRGGGSAEDLWAFNEEKVADAIHALATPVVSAVGHEVDILISDFVADLRAPTPSAAIEMILPDRQELLYTIDELMSRMSDRMAQVLHYKTEALKQREEELRRFSISSRLKHLQDDFDDLEKRYREFIHYKLERSQVLLTPVIEAYRQQIDFIIESKRRQTVMLQQQYLSSDPRKRVKEGWAQVLIDGKSTPLASIEPEISFTLEDANTKIEAVCRRKERF